MKTNQAKRRVVMERSMRLGHCICEPRRPCPCDVFRDHGLCPCAGERPESALAWEVRLLEGVKNAGCASKIAPADLEEVLARLPEVRDPAVLSGLAAADDAAIYRVAEGVCLVQTVDVFTPCVDDPHLFGRICAANCLSDVYATGGEPRTALSVLAFPSETMPGEVMYRMLSGAMEVLGEAGVALVGGHSIKDDEIKLGFAVTGVVDPAVAESLDRPCAGDVLVLTKPLGTGVLMFAQQVGRGHAAGMASAAQSMQELNRGAAEAMREAGASACTDVTGFGLLGHLKRMLRRHGLGAHLDVAALPLFEGVLDLLRNDVIPGALERNREFVGETLEVREVTDLARVDAALDAQTSGGLLMAIAPERLAALEAALAARGGRGVVLGRLEAGTEGRIVVSEGSMDLTGRGRPGRPEEATHMSHEKEKVEGGHGPGCCADVLGGVSTVGTAPDSLRAFGALMRSVQSAGALSEREKELVLFGLVVQSRCGPCLAAHVRKAQGMGITRAELDEAAWCAIAMGGAPVRMFYEEGMAGSGTVANPG